MTSPSVVVDTYVLVLVPAWKLAVVWSWKQVGAGVKNVRGTAGGKGSVLAFAAASADETR